MGAHDKPLCKISMFLAGFIFFTPHRIAITCANHVVKRFHLPLGTVAMFVYRLHNLMELGSFAGSVINTVIKLSTTTLSEDSKTTLKNCVSGISIWTMFVWSIITCISFMAGGEYGYFGEFFWNIVMLVFIYGVYSNSVMGIEGLNAPLYIVGLPLFGVFTFVFHKLYKYLYYIYFWDEYDYILVLYQIWIMMILSLATSIVWTVARVQDSAPGKQPTTIALDISKMPGENQTTTYGEVNSKVKVTKMEDVLSFKFYIHTLPNGGKFNLKKEIKRGSSDAGSLVNDIPNVYEVYYYFKSDNNNGALKVKTSSDAKIFYINDVNTTGTWTKYDNKTDPPGDLGPLVNQIKDEVEIKVEKTKPYGCKKRITVEKKDNTSASDQVPTGYVRYKHSTDGGSTSFNLGLIRYKDIPLKFNQDPPHTGVTAVYVYYKQSDSSHDFPLIVCVKMSGSTQKYYKRGNKWTEVTSPPINKGPEDTGVDTELQNKLNEYIQQYEVKLEKDATRYKATPQAGGNITPTEVTERVEGGTPEYKGFKHSLPGGTGTINYISIYNHVIPGISELTPDGYEITNANGGVYVYFPLKDSKPDLKKPLLICLSQDYTKSNQDGGNNIWYERKYDSEKNVYSWHKDETANFRDIKPGGTSGNQIEAGLKQKLGTISGNVGGDPGYPKLEPNLSDTMKSKPDSGLALLFGFGDSEYNKYHIIHWSPIFLVALSLGTVYFFYPAISPYQLVDDPFDGKKIELWIQAISATPHIAFAITQLCNKGPGRLWLNTDQEDDNYKWYALYHATWLFFIPYIICIYIFFSMMHFPDGRIGKYFRASVFRTGVLCVVFAWVQEFMEAVGFGGGMGAQVSGRCGDNFNDDAGTIFGFMFPVFMVIFMFTEDFYLKLFINRMFP